MKKNNTIQSLITAQDLSKETSRVLFRDLFCGKVTPEESKQLLLLLARKGESADEIAGCLAALRELEKPFTSKIPFLLDTCGTGGDGSHSMNISTLAALVIAGAGGNVAKHGNRSLSSRCGSSDLLEALGVNLEAGIRKMIQAVEQTGIGYFHAPFYHPVFSRLQPLRKALGVRTIFNSLGPLVNPLKLQAQLIGVSRMPLVQTFAEVLRGNKTLRAFVFHSDNGMDELTTASSAHGILVEKGKMKRVVIHPGKLGFKKASLAELKGGDVKYNQKLALKLLSGEVQKGGLYDAVLLNAGAGLWVSKKARDLKQGIKLARTSLKQGKAYLALQGLVRISNS